MSYITIQIFENSSIFAQNKKIYPKVFTIKVESFVMSNFDLNQNPKIVLAENC